MNATQQLLILEMKSYIEKAENGNIDLKLGATIRQHTLEVEKTEKDRRKAEKEAQETA